MKIDGGCHCGYITYEAGADPERVGICHCNVIPAPQEALLRE
jgi:hypothetical protein